MNQEIALAKRASKMEYSEVYPRLKSLLGYAYQFCGRTPNGNTTQEQQAEVDVQISILIDTLNIGDNRYLTFPEIQQAFKEGLNLLNGTNYGLNNETYAKFLASFIAKKKAAPDYSLNQKILAARTEVTEEEKERIHKEALVHCLNVFKETGDVVDLGNAIYRTLWRKRLIQFDKDKWEEYLKEAESIEYLRLTNEQNTLQKMGQARSRDHMFRLKEIDVELELMISGDKGVEVLARKLALRDYLRTLDVQT